MSTFKPTMKFGRKVFVIPFEKMQSVQPTNSQNHLQQNEDSNTDEDKMQHSRQKTNEEQLTNLLKDQFTSKQDFENSMALTYLLHLDPVTNAKHRELLQYLQSDSSSPPHDKRLLYHKLDIAEVPLSLIGNDNLRKAIEEMRNDKADTDSASDVDYDGDDSSGEPATEEDFAKILGKAWQSYLRKSREKKKKKKILNKSVKESAKKRVTTKKAERNKVKPVKKESQSGEEWIKLF